MGSHYIPVGKIKIDKEILDIACPAAGYDETPPPPEIYCPANGYEAPEPFTEEPEPPLIPPGDGEFVFLVDNTLSAYIRFNISGNFDAVLTELDGTVINSGIIHYLPRGEYKRYLFRVKGNASGEVTRIYRYNTGANTMPILWAWIKPTSALFSLSDFMRNVTAFKGISLDGDFSGVISFSHAFDLTGIEKFEFPASLPSLEDVSYMFNGTQLRELVCENVYAPNLCNLSYFAKGTFLTELNMSFPSEISENGVNRVTFQQFAMNVSTLKSVNLNFTIASDTSNYVDFTSMFNNCHSLKSLTLPYLESGEFSCYGMFDYCSKIPEIIFRGNSVELGASGTGYLVRETFNLRKVTFDFNYAKFSASFINSLAATYGKNLLEELHFPGMSDSSTLFTIFESSFPTLKKITGGSNVSDIIRTLRFDGNYPLETLDTNFTLGALVLGTTSYRLPLKTININWADSFYTNYNYAYINLHCDLSGAELDRIFGLLPTVTVGMPDKIYIQNATGKNDCTPSIAEAKGWTVYI